MNSVIKLNLLTSSVQNIPKGEVSGFEISERISIFHSITQRQFPTEFDERSLHLTRSSSVSVDLLKSVVVPYLDSSVG